MLVHAASMVMSTVQDRQAARDAEMYSSGVNPPRPNVAYKGYVGHVVDDRFAKSVAAIERRGATVCGKRVAALPTNETWQPISEVGHAQQDLIDQGVPTTCLPCLTGAVQILNDAWGDYIVIEETDLADAQDSIAHIRKKIRKVYDSQRKRAIGKRGKRGRAKKGGRGR